MHLHINLAKLYLMLDNIEINFKVPWLNKRNLIFHVLAYLTCFCVFGIFIHISILSGIYNILLEYIKNLNEIYIYI
jgi:hypothetical protein